MLNFFGRIKRLLMPSPVAPETCWQRYGAYVRIHPDAVIAPNATLSIPKLPRHPRVMFEIGPQSQLFGHVVLVRPEATVKIGARTQIGNSHIIAGNLVEIGDDVLMAWGITLMDNDSHSVDWAGRSNDVVQCFKDYKSDPFDFTKNKDWSSVRSAPIRIGNRAWIGFNAILLKGVEVGDESVVGAGSVVRSSLEPKSLVMGNPASVVRILGQTSSPAPEQERSL